MTIEQIIEKIKNDIELNKDEILSSDTTEIEKIMLRAFNNRINIYIPDLESALQTQNELIDNMIEFHKLNTCFKQYECMQNKICNLNFDYNNCIYVKIRKQIEFIKNKSWEEIIKTVEGLRFKNKLNDFEAGFNCAIHDVLLILRQQNDKNK